MHLFHKKRKSLKFQFEFSVHHLMKLPKEGVILYASWNRGKKWSGETKKSFVKNSTAVMEADFQFRCTLFLNTKDKFKKKYLTIAIHEGVQSPSKKNKIGELNLNLAEFASQSGDFSQTRTFSVKLWNDSCEAQLKLTLKSTIIIKSGSGGGAAFTDDSMTDLTTMTDASLMDDDDDDDDSGGDDNVGNSSGVSRRRSRSIGRTVFDQRGTRSEYTAPSIGVSPVSLRSAAPGPFHRTRSGSSNTLSSPIARTTKRLSLRRTESDDDDDDGDDNHHVSDNGSNDGNDMNADGAKNRGSASIDYISKRSSLVERQFASSTKNHGRSGVPSLDSVAMKHLSLGNGVSDPASSTTAESGVGLSRRVMMLSSRERRRQNMSVSMDNDQDTFLQAIASAEEKSPRGRRGSVGNTTTVPEKSSTKLQSALNKISTQEQELRQLYTKLAERDRAETEQTLLNTVFVTLEPCFHQGIPVPAPLIFKALQYWDCFHPNKKAFLDKVVIELERAIAASRADSDILCYWFSNALVFLNLMQKEFPVSLDEDIMTDRARKRHEEDSVLGTTKLTTFTDIPDPYFNNIKELATTTTTTTSANILVPGSLVELEDFAFESPVAKYKSDIQLLAYKAYSTLTHNVYRNIAPKLLPAFFLVKDSNGERFSISSVISVLSKTLSTFKENYIHGAIVQQFMAQTFYFINAYVFNAIVAPNSTLCTMGNAINMKMALTSLELWANEKGDMTSSAKNELSHLRQVSNVLIMNKSSMVDFNTRSEVCPDINLKQIRRLLQMYRPDEYDPDEVPKSVIRALPTEKEEEQERQRKMSKDGAQCPQRTLVLADDGIAIDSRVIFKPTNRFINAELPQWRSVTVPPSLKSKPEFAFLVK